MNRKIPEVDTNRLIKSRGRLLHSTFIQIVVVPKLITKRFPTSDYLSPLNNGLSDKKCVYACHRWRSQMLAAGFCFVAVVTLAAGDGGLEVAVAQGLLRGTTKTTRGGRSFGAFEGIPFAQPPLGELRFKVIFLIFVFAVAQSGFRFYYGMIYRFTLNWSTQKLSLLVYIVRHDGTCNVFRDDFASIAHTNTLKTC